LVLCNSPGKGREHIASTAERGAEV